MAVKINKNGNSDNQVPNLIAQGTNIVGDIVSEGDFRIEGSIKGKIHAKGRIVIGKSGSVEGEIVCLNADICGKIEGKIDVKDLTIFKATSSFNGEIITSKISIESGALFSGSCTMTKDRAKQ